MNYEAKRVSDLKGKGYRGGHSDIMPEIQEFVFQLSKEMRGLQFEYKNTYQAYVYMEGHPFCMGYIAFGDFRESGKGDSNYVVYSHKIRNMKYSTYSLQHHMAMSIHLKDGVKNAKRYLQNFDMIDIAVETVHNVKLQFSSARDKVRKNAKDIKDKLFTSEAMYREMEHLSNSGHVFIDPAFGQQVKDFITSQQEHKVSEAKMLNLCLVRVYEKFGTQHFDVLPIDNANKHYLRDRSMFNSEGLKTYTDDTLPGELAGKLSVVNILSQDQYVEDVGYAVGDGMYYVSI